MQRAVSWHEEMTSSMLLSLKDTFHHVQEDISASFHRMRGTDPKLRSRSSADAGHSGYLNAGEDILHRYQQYWADIHNDITDSAKQAQVVHTLTGQMLTHCEQQSSRVSELHHELSSTLPSVLQCVEGMSRALGELHGSCDELEEGLTQLEDLIELQQLHELQVNHRLQLASYREKKRADVLTLQDDLSREYSSHVEQRERRQQQLQQEKCRVYGENFQQDLMQYKLLSSNRAAAAAGESGRGGEQQQVSVTAGSVTGAAGVTLEQVQIECDRSELDRFLQDDHCDTPEFDGRDSKLYMSVSPVVTPMVTPPGSVVTPQDAVVTPQDAVVTPQDVVVTPQDAVVTPQDVVVTPQDAVVTPQDAVVTPQDSVVTPQDAVVTPQDAVVTPQDSVVTPQDAVVTPQDAVVTPQDAVVTPQDAVVTPQDAVVTPQDAVVTPQDDVVTPQDVVVTPQDDVVTPQDDVVTPQDDVVIPQDSPDQKQ